MTSPLHSVTSRRRFDSQRGGLLVTALLLAALIALGLAGYLQVSRSSLGLAHRTFFANAALNLAEAGLEEANYCFNQMGAGTSPATAWSDWTIVQTNAMRTLPPFNLDQNAIGIVKVYVSGYNGSSATTYVISQATITPFDGSAPIVKILQSGIKQPGGYFTKGVVGVNGVKVNGKPVFDSFNSNPAKSPTGPWAPYSSTNASANTSVVVKTGTLDLGNGSVKGNVNIGSGVTAPAASQVTGSIETNFSGAFAMPPYPTATSVSKSYNLGSSLPAKLPAAGDLPAADGRYYYFVTGATIGNTTIVAGKNVTIVGQTTSMSSGLTIGAGATCTIYMDGTISASGNGSINNSNWAGALQIFTSTSGTCEISGNGELQACLYAPNATLKAAGGGNSGQLVGSFIAKTITTSGHMDFHYDEALGDLGGGGSSTWKPASWSELQSSSARASVGSLTGNFLP
ncbi:MAG: hypothetical protein HZA31_12835 [Opitutae bacterium]|nr:hypothetical protein [Opitutae bacterium]